MDNLPRLVHDFRRLYQRAAADGRGEMLFGKDTCELATKMLRGGAINEAVAKAASPTSDPPLAHLCATPGQAGFYFEFPLTGKPRMDLLIRYHVSELASPVTFFDGGDGFGYRAFFDECARDETLSEYICGYEFDISDGRDMPGVYLVPYDAPFSGDYVPNMLKRLGFAECTEAVLAAFGAAPRDWVPYYIGCMRGRPRSPTRIGFYVTQETRDRYANNVAAFVNDIERYYKTPFAPSDRVKMDAITKTGNLWEIQFDLYPPEEPGGVYTFGDGLGLGINFGKSEMDARKMSGFLDTGKAGELMRMLESWGIADARWHTVDKTCYAISRVIHENGRRKQVADLVRLHSLKVRFKGGRASAAKIYLLAETSDLEN